MNAKTEMPAGASALDSVKLHGVTEDAYNALATAIRNLASEGATALIAACTEASLVLERHTPDLPWLDPLQILEIRDLIQRRCKASGVVFNYADVAVDQLEFPQSFPKPGWVEHDPEAIWDSVTAVTRGAMQQAGAAAADISSIGITNQRETTVIWDRETGEPVYNAIVWQDRRTAD